MYTQNQLQQYFERIGYKGNGEISLETLRALQSNHLYSVPYETLDQMNDVSLSLDKDAIFHKIVTLHRGGYCFETQGLLYYVLKTLGFNVVQFAGRFMNEPGVIQMRRHRVLIITLGDKRYVCDVGMRSETSRFPLELTEELIQSDGVGEYKFRKDDFYGWVIMQRLPGKDWKDLYGFTEELQVDDDFVMPSFYCEKHPDSPFNKTEMFAVKTAEGRKTMDGNIYKEFKNGEVFVKELTDEQMPEGYAAFGLKY